MSDALHPCPFCKSRCVTGWTEEDGNNIVTDAWIECDDCSARGPTADSNEEAIAKWNAAGSTYTDVCKNEKCPRGGMPVEVIR